MSKAITDTNGVALTILGLSVTQNSDSQIFVIEVPVSAGMSLTCDGDPSASVMARRTGGGSAFQDIAVSPISLTPFAGSTVQFDLKIHANTFAGLLKRVSLPVRVKYL